MPLVTSTTVIPEFDVRRYGADPTGATDSQTMLVAAIAAAKAAGAAVYVPPGTFAHSGALTLDGVRMFGDGPTSILKATTPTAATIILTGTAPELCDVAISTTGVARLAGTNASGVLVNVATRALVSGVTVLSAANVGIMVNAASFARIIGNHVQGTLADGIYTTNVSHHITIADNVVSGPGDDCISVVSYVADEAQCHDITITGNVVDSGSTRGITVVGGIRISLTGNVITNMNDTGISVISDSTALTYGSTDISISANVLMTTSTGSDSQPSIAIFGRSGFTVNRVIVQGNTIRDGRYGAILVNTFAGEVLISGNSIFLVGGTAAIRLLGCESVSVLDNLIEQTIVHAIHVDNAATGILRINGNTFRDIVTQSNAGVDICLIDSGSTVDLIEFNYNYHAQPGGYACRNLIRAAGNPQMIATGNYSTVGKYIYAADGTRLFVNADQTMPRQMTGYYGAAPTAGTWSQGDLVYHYAPVAGGNVGWVCTAAGTPGTWKTFGAIAA